MPSGYQTSRLSKECIQTVLVHLMAEEDIEEISISRIVKKGGVSRTAFYNNYKSKQDVLACVIATLMERQIQLTLEVITTEDRGKVFAGIFQAVREDPQQLEMLLKSGIDGSDFLNIRSFLSDQYPQLTGGIRFLLFGWGGMIRSILLDWFFQGMSEDEEEMGALCAKLSEDIMRGFARWTRTLLRQSQPSGTESQGAARRSIHRSTVFQAGCAGYAEISGACAAACRIGPGMYERCLIRNRTESRKGIETATVPLLCVREKTRNPGFLVCFVRLQNSLP